MRHVSFTNFFARNAWAMRFCAVQSRSLHPLALPRSVFLALLSLFPCHYLTLSHLSHPLMHGWTAQTANLLAFTLTGVTHCKRGSAVCIQARQRTFGAICNTPCRQAAQRLPFRPRAIDIPPVLWRMHLCHAHYCSVPYHLYSMFAACGSGIAWEFIVAN